MKEARANKARGVIYVILASLCYGITPILSNTALKGGLPGDFLSRFFASPPSFLLLSEQNAMPNESVVGFSMSIACVISLLNCLIGRRSLRVTGRQALELALWGGGGFAATMLLISYAYLSIPAGMTIVLNFTYPLIVALISALFFKEKLSPLGVFALVPALIGIALISGLAGSGGSGVLGEDPALGIPLALLSGLAYAVYFLAGRHASYRMLDTSVSNVYITASAAAICFTVALCTGRFRLPPTWFLWFVLISSGIIGLVFGLRLLLAGIRLLGSVTASALNTLEPVFASMTSMLVFGELMTPLKAAGAVLVLIGALLSILAMRRRSA